MAEIIFVPFAVSGGGGGSGSRLESAAGAWSVPGAVAIGDVVYATGSFAADVADRSSALTMPAIGVVIAKPTAVTATLLYYGESPAIFGGLLTPGVEYYVGLAGAIEAPSAAMAGEIVQRVGVAATTSTLLFTPDPTTVKL